MKKMYISLLIAGLTLISALQAMEGMTKEQHQGLANLLTRLGSTSILSSGGDLPITGAPQMLVADFTTRDMEESMTKEQVQETLVSAVKSNNIARAERMLKLGADVNGLEYSCHCASGIRNLGRSGVLYTLTRPLLVAAEKGHLPVAISLLKHKANVKIRDEITGSPLTKSLEWDNPSFGHKAIATLILAHSQTTAADIEYAYYNLERWYPQTGRGHLTAVRALAYHADKENSIQLLQEFDNKYKIFSRALLNIINSYCGLYHDVTGYPLLSRALTVEEKTQLAEIKKALAIGYSIYSSGDHS
jgi:hypothetical protein